MYRKVFLLCIFIFEWLILIGQTNDTLFYGKVINQSGEPLINANIVNLTNNRGTITNIHGAFSLAIKKIPFTIEVSYMGYEKRTITITQEQLDISKGSFDIVLQRKVYELKEIELSSEAEKIKFESTPSSLILDYEIGESGLILLIKNNRDRILKISDKYGKCFVDTKLHFKARDILEDCRGTIHLATADSTYQLLIDTNSVYVYPAVSLSKYNEILSNCIGYQGGNFIFRAYSAHNQRINYWVVTDKMKKDIFIIYDKNRYLFAQNSLDRKNELIRKYGVIDEMGDISINNLRVRRKIMQWEWFYNMVGVIPSYNPLFILNDTIIIFDHVSDSIFFLDNDFKTIKTVPIQYQHNDSWGNMIFKDKVTNKFYLKFIRSGIIVLKELDIYTGKIVKEIKLDNRLFPQKITIYDNHIYYIFKDSAKEVNYLMDREIE